jgi:hypothetical protein
MACIGCYDERRAKKRIKILAQRWTEATGEQTELYKMVIGGKVHWNFRVILKEKRDD